VCRLIFELCFLAAVFFSCCVFLAAGMFLAAGLFLAAGFFKLVRIVGAHFRLHTLAWYCGSSLRTSNAHFGGQQAVQL
jgi:hypothetical protein